MAEKGADYMVQAGPVRGTARLIGQPRKRINFIQEEISDHGKRASSFPLNCNSRWAIRPNKFVVLSLQIFRNRCGKK